MNTISEESSLRTNERDEEYCEDNIAANRLLWHVKQLDNELIEKEKEKTSIIEETKEFYDRSIAKIKDKQSYLLLRLEGYLRGTDQKRVTLPNGSIKLHKHTEFVYPDDTTLLKFSEEFGLEYTTTTISKPSKTNIKEFVKQTGVSPEGFEMKDTLRFKYDV